MSKEIDILKRRLAREHAARKQAEGILEAKAKELYEVNQSLEAQVKERTAALKKSEQQYRSIVESADDIIYNIDSNGNFSFVNPAGLSYTGYPAEEVIGQSFLKVIRNDYKEEVQKFYLDVLVNKKNKTYSEFPISTKSGETLWIGQNVKMIQDGNDVISFSVLARDITKRKIAEAERNRLSKEIKKAQLIAESAQAAEAEFLASMSHEMRTPLNAIIGMSHLLQDAKLNEDEAEYLDILVSSATVLQQLISDVLDISKIDAGHLELQQKPFDLFKLIKNLERTFSIKMENKDVTVKIDTDLVLENLLIGDELILNQIFLNLLGNAEKFTNHGEIIIGVKQILNTENKVRLDLSVSDTGMGMDPDQLEKIFEQFKQASSEIRREYGGTGLGLAITKKLISLYNSEIKVLSQKGKGTKFSFELELNKSKIPIAKEEELFVKKLEFSDIDNPVLIVEDNVMNQKYITKLFEKWKLKYVLTQNGKEAVEACSIQKYSMIFMDIQMPILDGYQATMKIRASKNLNNNTPIVALTASTLLSKKQLAINSGMTDFLSKPFNPNQLSRIILNHLSTKNVSEIANTDSSIFRFNPKLDAQYLIKNYQDDLEYCADMMEIFIETIPEEITVLDQSMKEKDFQNFAKTAHKLKPTFTMVGLSKLSKAFEILELDAKIESNDAFKKFKTLRKEISDGLKLVALEKEKILNQLKNT